MTLNPQVQIVLDRMKAAEAKGNVPDYTTMPPPEVRAYYKTARNPLRPPSLDIALAEDGAAGDIPLRYYRPLGSVADETLPVLIYFHGGGWIYGDLDTHDGICRALANTGGFAVISVDYRLAPEDPFPAGLDDAYAVVKWAADGAGGWNIDANRIAVGGDSAGGNFAAVVSLMARDEGVGGPSIKFQALLYPSTSFQMDSQSHADFGEGYVLTHQQQVWVRETYLGNLDNIGDWRASPLAAADFAGLPPAFVLTCGYDPLRDEGKAYADKLAAAGCAVTYKCFDGQVHGFLGMGGVVDEAGDALAEIAQAVKAGLG